MPSSTSSPTCSSRATSSSTAATPTFTDTIRREKAVRETGINFVGAGISGGEEGALKGPCIMPGGSDEAWETLGPILESIAAVAEGEPCVTHVGTDGAGHFVKMIHNGIEYADMQLIAEAYDLLRNVGGHSPAEIADVFAEWNTGDLESYLIEITAEVLRQVDAKTGKPLVDIVLDQAGSKGTGVWTVQNALDLGVPVGGIAEAVFARAVSSHPEQRDGRAGHRRVSSGCRCSRGRDVLRRRRARRALRLEGRRLLPGLRRDHRRRREVRLGHRQGRDRQDLARRLHHPRPVPQPHRRRLRQRPRPSRRCWSTRTSPRR